jgi:hypothetical protein
MAFTALQVFTAMGAKPNKHQLSAVPSSVVADLLLSTPVLKCVRGGQFPSKVRDFVQPEASA